MTVFLIARLLSPRGRIDLIGPRRPLGMSAAKGCETPGRGVSWVGPSVARSIRGSRWWP